MDWLRQEQLKDLGFTHIHDGKGLHGARYWYKRTGSELCVVRQADDRSKTYDIGDAHPQLPADTPEENRRWALELVHDDLIDWQE